MFLSQQMASTIENLHLRSSKNKKAEFVGRMFLRCKVEGIKVLPENGVIRRGHIEDNLNNFYNK